MSDEPALQRRPEIAVGGVAVIDDRILLIRRGHGPAAGTWSIPGGRVRFGEDLREAVVREVAEETGLECVVECYLGWTEQIQLMEDPEPSHFVILDFLVDVADPDAEPVAGDDAAEAAWWPLDDIADLQLAPGLLDFLEDVDVLTDMAILAELTELDPFDDDEPEPA